MFCRVSPRSWAIVFITLAVAGCVFKATIPWSAAAAMQAKDAAGMGPQKRAEALGIKFEKLPASYLNGCARAGKLLFTSGFASKTKGRLGKDLTVKEGYQAARQMRYRYPAGGLEHARDSR